MIQKMGYSWNLRRLMAERDLFQTSDLCPLLAERLDIFLSHGRKAWALPVREEGVNATP